MSEQSEVVEATVLGQNCAACKWERITVNFAYDEVEDWEINIAKTILCCFNYATWDEFNRPVSGTKHPPGRSVCPLWEECPQE
jgi:hypothetical protein